jgi:uncharacterized protein (TIGR02246 family)
MKRILFLVCLLCTIAIGVVAQNGSPELEVSAFIAKVREAVMRNDASFLASALADDYIWSAAGGTTETKAQSLEFYRQERAKPRYKILSNTLDNEQIRLIGNVAIVTGDFRFLTTFTKAHPGDPVHTDTGRYTGVLQKRNGRWQIIVEHDSEKPHDKKEMEPLVAALGRAYTDMIRRNDAAAIAKILADDYLVTDENGKRLTKEEDLATYKDRAETLKIEKVEYLDQKVRMITGSVAIDHSTIRFLGTRNGKPFDITERITTTWQFHDGRWLIVADHFSFLKP